jgi:amidase
MRDLWQLSAVETVAAIKNKTVSVQEVTQSVLDRIAQTNPRINALPVVCAEQALVQAQAADKRQALGEELGPLHGVPVTIKVNVDTAGFATTDGIVALKDNIATSDSPVVASLRNAGAIIVGLSNTPAFSLRWFTDNDLHGRTLNPFDASVTPGGSSGGAAAAVACGMGSIALGSDYGGSIRYPAWACGVVGLRTTVGRVPSYKASMPARMISNQQMSVQGPLSRTVADARLAFEVMAQGSALDPQWVPAPFDYPTDLSTSNKKIALFKTHAGSDVDPSVSAALQKTALVLSKAGYEVVEIAPPHFEESATLWRDLVFNDLRRGGKPAIESMGDNAVKAALAGYLEGVPHWTADQYLDALTRRFSIARDWAVFLEEYPVLLMPNSWQKQFPIDADTLGSQRMRDLLVAQSPLLSTAMLGLPGLSVPTGMDNGLPTGVQLVSNKFREDRLFKVARVIEESASFSVLKALSF